MVCVSTNDRCKSLTCLSASFSAVCAWLFSFEEVLGVHEWDPSGGKKGARNDWGWAGKKVLYVFISLCGITPRREVTKKWKKSTPSHPHIHWHKRPSNGRTGLGVWVRWSLAELLSVAGAVMENYIHPVHTFIGLCLLGIVQQTEQGARPDSTPRRQPVPLTLSATGNIRNFVAVKLSVSVLLSTQPSLDMLLGVSIAHLPGECWGCYMQTDGWVFTAWKCRSKKQNFSGKLLRISKDRCTITKGLLVPKLSLCPKLSPHPIRSYDS